jgi:hypothetical protein
MYFAIGQPLSSGNVVAPTLTWAGGASTPEPTHGKVVGKVTLCVESRGVTTTRHERIG